MLLEPADALLADIAIRIQLRPTAYAEAVQRYGSIKDWIERDVSPLYGLVELFYPQGSMATRSTIASKLRTDEFDLDIIAALLLDPDMLPERCTRSTVPGNPRGAWISVLRNDGETDSMRHGSLRERNAPGRNADGATSSYA